MLNEYAEIRESLVKESPRLTPDNLDRLSAIAFQDRYDISLDKANQLSQEKQWERWLVKHQDQTHHIYSTQLKAREDHGRFVEFDLITSDIDQSSDSNASKSFSQQYDDLITPEAIAKVEQQLKGSIINMIDPVEVKDFTELVSDGAKYGGIGHEHVATSSDIVPALIIDQVKAVDNNTKLRVTAKVNENSRRADDVWAMIKNKTLKGASIEYKALKTRYKEIEGRVVRVIDDLILSGYALTSKMRNMACGVTGWFVKALPESDSSLTNEDNTTKQENTMADEENAVKTDEEIVDDAPVEEAPVGEEKKEEAPEAPAEEAKEEEPADEVKALKKEIASLRKQMDEIKALEADKKFIDEKKDIIKEEIKSALDAEQKALVEEEQKKFEEVKAAKDEVKATIEKEGLDAAWAKVAQKHNKLGVI
jgi:hypothetical protein